MSFVDPWKLATVAEVPYFSNQVFMHTDHLDSDHDQPYFMMWFAIRYFSEERHASTAWSAATGFELAREMTMLPTLPESFHAHRTKHGCPIREARDVLLLKAYPGPATSCFSITFLSDHGGSPWDHFPIGRQPSNDEHTIRGPLTPVLMYIELLRKHFKGALSQWSNVLGRIEEEIELKISDDNLMSRIMFDQAGLEKSKFYFKVLQLLRIMHDSVEDTKQRVAEWPLEWQHQFRRSLVGRFCSESDLEALNTRWRQIEASCLLELNRIQNRIERKHAEIESLRDGLFNATSVREALQAGHTNQNIMVFTVVTIVYLPLPFVTAFFGMDNIPSDSYLVKSMAPFAGMIAAFAVVTYGLALISLKCQLSQNFTQPSSRDARPVPENRTSRPYKSKKYIAIGDVSNAEMKHAVELFAIMAAMQIAMSKCQAEKDEGWLKIEEVVVFSDSNQALEAIRDFHTWSEERQSGYLRLRELGEIKLLAARIQEMGVKSELRWAPAGEGVVGLDRVHEIARDAASDESVQIANCPNNGRDLKLATMMATGHEKSDGSLGSKS
ncbi:hypothetical protein PMZ80_002764 [Knufia obscura]|uniref:Uncharacterized protein n=1 Tax=Knufia obscura TaxID=1635080 RepID=A0ABR0RZ80_9EURO|nr:hypothetical protein PMZ80_002764 [Knufia obscura]